MNIIPTPFCTERNAVAGVAILAGDNIHTTCIQSLLKDTADASVLKQPKFIKNKLSPSNLSKDNKIAFRNHKSNL